MNVRIKSWKPIAVLVAACSAYCSVCALKHTIFRVHSQVTSSLHVLWVVNGGADNQAEVILSDWLTDVESSNLSYKSSRRLSPRLSNGPYWNSESYLGTLSLSKDGSDHDYKLSKTPKPSTDIQSAPYRFQRLVSSMWQELGEGSSLAYLGKEGQARLKRTMVVIAAIAALQEHPIKNEKFSPKEVFAEMDFDSNGEVTFEEFVRWYEINSIKKSGQKLLTPTKSTVSSTLNVSHSITSAYESSINGNDAIQEKGSMGFELGTSREISMPEHFPSEQVGYTENDILREMRLAEENSKKEQDIKNTLTNKLLDSLEVVKILVKAEADTDTIESALALSAFTEPNNIYNLGVIEEQFGQVVRDIVEERLFLKYLPYSMRPEDEILNESSSSLLSVIDLDDKTSRKIRDSMIMRSRDVRAIVVHIAQLIHELRGITGGVYTGSLVGDKAPGRSLFRGEWPSTNPHYLALEALQIYVPISNALGLGSAFRELEELSYKAIFPKTYKKVLKWHMDTWHSAHAVLHSTKAELLHALVEHPPLQGRVGRFELQGRTKGLVSTFRKIFRQNKKVEDVHDMIGLRIIVHPGLKQNEELLKGGNDFIVENLKKGYTSSDENFPNESVQSTEGAFDRGFLEEIPDRGHASSRTMEGLFDRGHIPQSRTLEGVSDRGHTQTLRAIEAENSHSKAREHIGNKDRLYTVTSYPPPYRDDDSVLLHEVYEVVKRLWIKADRYKNYVDFPKANGYQSIHTTIYHPTNMLIEVQIRTKAMHHTAESGGARHSFYKGGVSSPEAVDIFSSKMVLPHKIAKSNRPELAPFRANVND